MAMVINGDGHIVKRILGGITIADLAPLLRQLLYMLRWRMPMTNKHVRPAEIDRATRIPDPGSGSRRHLPPGAAG
jgi:hypothetical protein